MLTYLLEGIVYGLSAGFSPGPLLALVLSQSLKHGAREGIRVALAPLVTDLPIILISTLVLSQLSSFKLLLALVTLAGAVFVAYLGYESLRTAPRPAGVPASAPQSLKRGILVNALSPHPYLFWLMVGAPALVKAWNEAPLSAAAFVSGFYSCLVGSKVIAAALAARSRSFFNGPAYLWLMRLLGLLLLVFAILLFKDGLDLLLQ